MKTSKPISSIRGFTIVELLVVITVITLLVSVLLPTFQLAREQARVAICQSVLHSNCIAIGSYANDNRTLVPPAGHYQTHPVQTGRQWYSWVETHYDSITNYNYPKAGIGLALYPGYINTYRALYCPNIIKEGNYKTYATEYYWGPTPETAPYLTASGPYPQYIGIGYWYTGGWKTSGMTNFSIQPYQCQASIDETNVILMQDLFAQDYTTYAWTASHPRPLNADAGGSFLFTDGHVKYGTARGKVVGVNGWSGDIYAHDEGGSGLSMVYAVR